MIAAATVSEPVKLIRSTRLSVVSRSPTSLPPVTSMISVTPALTNVWIG